VHQNNIITAAASSGRANPIFHLLLLLLRLTLAKSGGGGGGSKTITTFLKVERNRFHCWSLSGIIKSGRSLPQPVGKTLSQYHSICNNYTPNHAAKNGTLCRNLLRFCSRSPFKEARAK
jgi:hypothetical protein